MLRAMCWKRRSRLSLDVYPHFYFFGAFRTRSKFTIFRALYFPNPMRWTRGSKNDPLTFSFILLMRAGVIRAPTPLWLRVLRNGLGEGMGWASLGDHFWERVVEKFWGENENRPHRVPIRPPTALHFLITRFNMTFSKITLLEFKTLPVGILGTRGRLHCFVQTLPRTPFESCFPDKGTFRSGKRRRTRR